MFDRLKTLMHRLSDHTILSDLLDPVSRALARERQAAATVTIALKDLSPASRWPLSLCGPSRANLPPTTAAAPPISVAFRLMPGPAATSSASPS